MKKWLVVPMLTAAAATQGGVTPANVAQFVEGNAYWRNGTLYKHQSELYEAVEFGRADASLVIASKRLAKRWQISEDAALKAIEAVVFSETRPFDRAGEEHAKSAAPAFRAAVDAAPGSPQVWSLAVGYLADNDRGCYDDALRSEYLSKGFGVAEFFSILRCYNWMPALVLRYPDDLAAHFALVEYLRRRDPAAALAASHTLLAKIAARGASAPANSQMLALRLHWLLLAQAGLHEELLADAEARARVSRADLLDREALDLIVDGVEIDSDLRAKELRAAARRAWLYSLLSAGRIDEARAADARYGDAASHDVLRGAPAADLFDTYVGAGDTSAADEKAALLWRIQSGSQLEMRASAKFLAANRFDSAARLLEESACRRHFDTDELEWNEKELRRLPAAFGAERERFARLIAAADAEAGCAPKGEDAVGGTSSKLARFAEVPMSAAQKTQPLLPKYAGEIPLPASFRLVRAQRSGQDIAAICISPAVDPGGEVSPGGYWVVRSADGGNTWRPPLYLGFQMHQPFVVHEEARLSMFVPDALRIEVDVQELDPRSITFPPVGLRVRREAQDVYVDLPLAALEKDGDGDGLTDLVEARLRTDPANPDTDGDGLDDHLDDFPQVSARAAPHPLAEIIVDMLRRITGFERAGIVEPMRGKGAADDLFAPGRRGAAPGSYLFRFIEGDPKMFAGLSVDGQVIVLGAAEIAEQRARFGPFYPVSFPTILLDPKGNRALVQWSAGWVGGTILYTRKGGRWVGKDTSNWITRAPPAISEPHISPG